MADPGGDPHGRALALVAAAVIAVALIGFLTGTESEEYRALEPPTRSRAPISGEIPAARTHAELERAPWGDDVVHSGWSEAWEAAAPAAPAEDGDGTEDGNGTGSFSDALAERAALRAFAGAPPTIPHPVRANGAAECLACHGDGFALGERRASRIAHERYASCTQCHVTEASFTILPANAAARTGNRFAGLDSPGHGATAYEDAPPAVPHRTFMREDCGACHGPGGRAGLRTPHPERRSCLQCHPASAGLRASR